MRFDREEVIKNLNACIDSGRLVLAAAAGNGLMARVEEKAGADLIIVYNSGQYRMNGIASIAGNLPIGDANQIVYDMGKYQILNMAKKTPVVAGIYGVDPTRDMEEFLTSLKTIGYSGVINFPTIGKLSGPIRQELEQVNLGFKREVESLVLAKKLGFFTMAYCYNPEEAVILAESDIDIIVSHVGLTAGGDVGVTKVSPLDAAIEKTEAILSAAKKVKPSIITMCHGGPIVSPDDVRKVVEKTIAVGFVAASSVERLPVEGAVSEIVKDLKSITL